MTTSEANTSRSTAPGAMAIASQRRQQRAEVARRLLDEAAPLARALDWRALDEAPAWLGLSAASRGLFARRVGSVLAAPALRLWIAAPRIAAARIAVGAAWWQALVARDDWPPLPPQIQAWPDGAAIDAAGVSRVLHEAGGAVLLATLPHGALRHAASQLLAPVAAFLMPGVAAQALLQTALQLQCSLAHDLLGVPEGA